MEKGTTNRDPASEKVRGSSPAMKPRGPALARMARQLPANEEACACRASARWSGTMGRAGSYFGLALPVQLQRFSALPSGGCS